MSLLTKELVNKESEMRIVKWRIIFSELRITATALRSAGHLENVQPGTAAEVIYKS